MNNHRKIHALDSLKLLDELSDRNKRFLDNDDVESQRDNRLARKDQYQHQHHHHPLSPKSSASHPSLPRPLLKEEEQNIGSKGQEMKVSGRISLQEDGRREGSIHGMKERSQEWTESRNLHHPSFNPTRHLEEKQDCLPLSPSSLETYHRQLDSDHSDKRIEGLMIMIKLYSLSFFISFHLL